MQKNAVIAAIVFSLITFILSGSAAFADMCALKNGEYTLSSKYNLDTLPPTFTTGTGLETQQPCTSADTASGGADNIISLDFSLGQDITVDIVYEQDPANQYRIDNFTYVLFYDTTNMSIGDEASGDCNPDPAGFFAKNMCTEFAIDCCGNGVKFGTTTPAVVYQFSQWTTGDSWPAEAANFVLDQLSFANTYSAEGTDVSTLTFDVNSNDAYTTNVAVSVGSGQTCSIFTMEEPACATLTVQEVMASKISLSQPPCFIGPPTTAAVSCAPDATTCADAITGNDLGNVTLTYDKSTQKCYENSACVTPSTTGACSGITSAAMGVEFNNLSGVKQSNQTSGTYSETAAVGTTPSYVLKGVHTSSTCQSCTTTKTVTASAACACGDAPTIVITSNIEKTFYEGSDISITYEINDTDTDMSDLGEIKFYYTDDITQVAQVYTVSNGTEVKKVSGNNNKATLTVKIPKEYVTEDVPIYFGIVMQDDVGLKGVYPDPVGTDSDFAVNVDGTISASLSSVIPGSNIKAATAFAFDTCCMPYPNQFPFVPTENGNNLLQIQFTLNAEATVSMRIYTMDGRLVRQIDNNTRSIYEDCEDEECNICNAETGCQWDGTDYQGGNNLVGNGMYIVNIHAIAIGDDNDFRGAVVDYTKGLVVMR